MRLTAARARLRFAASPVARLGTAAAAGTPLVVPVTFGVSPADVIYVAVDHKPKSTTRLRRLAHIAANPAVCFLADVYDDDWEQLWWARADCSAVVREVVSDEALSLLTAKYPQYAEQPPRGPMIEARVERWSGWAFASRG
jgi:PPOX class probable F420-dependent enzyme